MKQEFLVIVGAATDIGMVRDENQDTYSISPSDPTADSHSKSRLFIVADGMGGHKGGKVASGLAVKTIQRAFHSDESESAQESLAHAIQAANEVVFSASKKDTALRGMGTTCVAMVVKGSSVFVAHIGDSRVYHVTRERIVQMTEDHSTVAEMQRKGILTVEEARSHPERSVLYRALGTRSVAEIDLQPECTLQGEEWFVLCSDGLTNMVADDEIHDIVIAHPPEKACDQLVALANERGGYDNVTVIVVQVAIP